MAVQSVPSAMGVPKAPYASFSGKVESSLVVVPDTVIQALAQILTLSPLAQDVIQGEIQTLEVSGG